MHRIWDVSKRPEHRESAARLVLQPELHSFFVGWVFCGKPLLPNHRDRTVCGFLCSYPHPSCMLLICSFVDKQSLCSGITGSHQLVCKPCCSFFQGISETCLSGSNRICWKSDQNYLCKENLCKYNCYEFSLCFSVDPHSLGDFSSGGNFLLSKSVTMKTQNLLKW